MPPGTVPFPICVVKNGMPVRRTKLAMPWVARGRLVAVKHSGTVNHNVQTNYSYDKADNRTNKTVTGAP